MKRDTTSHLTHEPSALIGRYFHSIDAGQVNWQGKVISHPEPNWYVVQLFDWIVGEPNVQRLVKIEQMNGWLFYENSEQMQFSYEHGTARNGGPYRMDTK